MKQNFHYSILTHIHHLFKHTCLLASGISHWIHMTKEGDSVEAPFQTSHPIFFVRIASCYGIYTSACSNQQHMSASSTCNHGWCVVQHDTSLTPVRCFGNGSGSRTIRPSIYQQIGTTIDWFDSWRQVCRGDTQWCSPDWLGLAMCLRI